VAVREEALGEHQVSVVEPCYPLLQHHKIYFNIREM